MTLKNEIFEGIAAYKALTPTPQDDYYKYRLGQLKKKQKDDDAVTQGAKDEIDEQNRRRAAGGPPGTPVPTVASTAMPGSTQTALNTSTWDPTQPIGQANMPTDQQGGMIHAFKDGGAVDDESDVDRLVAQLLTEDRARGQYGGQTYGGETHGGAQFGGNKFGGNKFGGARFGASSPPDEPPPSTPERPTPTPLPTPPAEPSTPEERERAIWGQESVDRANAARDAAMATVRRGQAVRPMPGEDRAFAADWPPRDDREPPPSDTVPSAPGFEGAQPYAPIGTTTPGEAAMAARRAFFPPTSPRVEPPPAPVGAGAGTAAGQQVAAAAPQPAAPAPPTPPWTQQRSQPSLGVPTQALSTTPPSSPAPAPAPAPARPTGPTGTASTPAPPPTAGAANAPSTAPKGSLADQSRVTAFDPTADLNDPRNAHRVDQSGATVMPTQQDMHAVLNAGLQAAPGGGAQQPPPGQGAVSRPVFNQWVDAHNQGGRLTSGQALMVGMVGKYKVLLSQGRQAEASQMAWGLIQAANLEAASWGDVAKDQIHANNLPGAVASIAKAADLSPDGMHHRPSPDGRSIETYDNNGKLTATTPMDGRMALAAAMGLQDGTLMWAALQSTVASTQKPDRNAEGRQLTNDLRRQQIEGARLRNKKLASAGTGGGGGGSAAGAELAALFGQTNASAHVAGPPQGGGEDDSWIDRETTNPPDE